MVGGFKKLELWRANVSGQRGGVDIFGILLTCCTTCKRLLLLLSNNKEWLQALNQSTRSFSGGVQASESYTTVRVLLHACVREGHVAT